VFRRSLPSEHAGLILICMVGQAKHLEEFLSWGATLFDRHQTERQDVRHEFLVNGMLQTMAILFKV